MNNAASFHQQAPLTTVRCGQIVENKLKLIMHQLETDKHENKAWQMKAAINLEMTFIYYRGSGRRDQQKVLIILLHSALMNPYPDCLITADPRPHVLTEGWRLVIKKRWEKLSNGMADPWKNPAAAHSIPVTIAFSTTEGFFCECKKAVPGLSFLWWHIFLREVRHIKDLVLFLASFTLASIDVNLHSRDP